MMMEMEIFVMLWLCEVICFECFMYYLSWMWMKKVVKEEFVVMDVEFDCCVVELSDVCVDVFGYVCFVVIMVMGYGYYCVL